MQGKRYFQKVSGALMRNAGKNVREPQWWEEVFDISAFVVYFSAFMSRKATSECLSKSRSSDGYLPNLNVYIYKCQAPPPLSY